MYLYQKGDYESMRKDTLEFAKEKYFNGHSDTRSVPENFDLLTSFSQDSADKHIPSKTSRSVISYPVTTISHPGHFVPIFGHFVPRSTGYEMTIWWSIRTQVISYPFWLFRTHFGHFPAKMDRRVLIEMIFNVLLLIVT